MSVPAAVCAGLAVLAVASVTVAQPQAFTPGACEDRLRETRILADHLAQSRLRHEVEAARGMAELLKQIEMFRAEAERLRTKPKD